MSFTFRDYVLRTDPKVQFPLGRIKQALKDHAAERGEELEPIRTSEEIKQLLERLALPNDIGNKSRTSVATMLWCGFEEKRKREEIVR